MSVPHPTDAFPPHRSTIRAHTIALYFILTETNIAVQEASHNHPQRFVIGVGLFA